MIAKTVRRGRSIHSSCSLMLAAAAPAAEPSFSEPQKTEIEKIIRDYLVTHPEVLQEAIAELDKRQAAADTEKAKAAVAANAATLFDSTAPGRARQPQGRRHPGRVLRLQLRFLQRRPAGPRRPDEGRRQAQGRAQGVPGARPRLGGGGEGRRRRADAGQVGQEVSRLPPEAARRPRQGRQGPRARGRQGGRNGHGPARQGHGERRGPRVARGRASSSPRRSASTARRAT